MFCEKASSENVPSCAGGNADSAFSVCSWPCRTVLTRNTPPGGERRTRSPPRPIRRVRSFLSAAGGWAARKPFPENTSTFPFRTGVIPPSARGFPPQPVLWRRACHASFGNPACSHGMHTLHQRSTCRRLPLQAGAFLSPAPEVRNGPFLRSCRNPAPPEAGFQNGHAAPGAAWP